MFNDIHAHKTGFMQIYAVQQFLPIEQGFFYEPSTGCAQRKICIFSIA
jgi:hypothetical protein